LNVVRKTVGQYVMIPALKQVISYYSDDPAWTSVRPPLTELNAAQVHNIVEGLKKLDFDMPGLDRAQAKAA
jgi:4-hydroxy-tetrahydrodipicolinate synthase